MTATACDTSRRASFFRDDVIGAADQIEPRRAHLTQDPHGESGTRERLPPHELVFQPEFLADRAHFVLEQQTQRLDQLEPHVLRQAADVVMALDDVRRADHRTLSITSGYSVPCPEAAVAEWLSMLYERARVGSLA